ncbi:MAG: Integral rane protein TerC [Verrucomicrobiales bacterium]|nr:Integral rane protein TerC [Verrucomicrobiales bacterium]
MGTQIWIWAGFSLFILAMLAMDLGVFHRSAHQVRFKEALTWTGVWIVLAGLFGLGVWYFSGPAKALEFYTGYLIELSLSADNVFVFVLIFSYFAVPQRFQHKVLFWGVLGALIMRVLMIGVGVALIQKFAWLLYIFGAFLVFTGIKMILGKDQEIHPEQNPLVRWFTKLVPVTSNYQEDRFLVRVNGRRMATPLLVVLFCVEVSDLIFAVDSIPAIFSVTLDPFIVYTSNVFAIMGLRSLYFVLGGMVSKFYYLRMGLGGVLGFVGIKMLMAHTPFKIDTMVALAVVGGLLGLALVASFIRARWMGKEAVPTHKSGFPS